MRGLQAAPLAARGAFRNLRPRSQRHGQRRHCGGGSRRSDQGGRAGTARLGLCQRRHPPRHRQCGKRRKAPKPGHALCGGAALTPSGKTTIRCGWRHGSRQDRRARSFGGQRQVVPACINLWRIRHKRAQHLCRCNHAGQARAGVRSSARQIQAGQFFGYVMRAKPG